MQLREIAYPVKHMKACIGGSGLNNRVSHLCSAIAPCTACLSVTANPINQATWKVTIPIQARLLIPQVGAREALLCDFADGFVTSRRSEAPLPFLCTGVCISPESARKESLWVIGPFEVHRTALLDILLGDMALVSPDQRRTP
jgi:hypothetical protein